MSDDEQIFERITDPATVQRMRDRAAQFGIVIGDKSKPVDATKPTPNK